MVAESRVKMGNGSVRMIAKMKERWTLTINCWILLKIDIVLGGINNQLNILVGMGFGYMKWDEA